MTPFPEELNRRLIARIACLHLAPTATNQENLVRENVPIKQIYVTGNSAIDALEWASGLDVPFVNPAVQADVRQRPAPRARDRSPPRELGRRPARDRRGDRTARHRPSRDRVRAAAAPQPARACDVCVRCSQGACQRAALRARELRRVRAPARALRPRDHRLGRHSGGGSGTRQARARHARDRPSASRASTPALSRSSAPTRSGSSPSPAGC